MATRNPLRQHVLQQLWSEPLIGEGKLGKTYKVSGLDNEQLVLKISGFEDATTKEEHYFQQEVDTLARFDHPHIIKYIDGWEHRDLGRLSVHLLTEYATGGDLRTYLYSKCKKPPPVVTFGSWLMQIASGLDFIHSMGVIHRNLKTSNIMVDLQDSNIVLKIGDFGMSKVLENPDAMTMSVVGTPYFMSPEVLQRIPYNSKTDIWSFGCTAFEIATLTTIFQAKTLTTLISGVNRNAAAELVEQIKYDDFFKTLIRKMLNHDHKRRPDAGTVLQDLQDKGYTSTCSKTSISPSVNVSSQSQGKSQTQTKSSSTTSKSHKTSQKKSDDVSVVSDVQSSRTSSTTSSIDDGSMAVYPVSNLPWGEIDRRSVRGQIAEVAVIPLVIQRSKGRLRAQSEGSHPPEIGAALEEFSQMRRKKSTEERLSKSGPLRFVSFDTPIPETSSYISGEDDVTSSHAGICGDDGDDDIDAESVYISDEQPEADEGRLLCQIERLQSNLFQTLGDGVFQVAFNTLRIPEDDKMAEELESVLGDKYNEFGLQFATLRLLDNRIDEYEKPSVKKGGSLNQTI